MSGLHLICSVGRYREEEQTNLLRVELERAAECSSNGWALNAREVDGDEQTDELHCCQSIKFLLRSYR